MRKWLEWWKRIRDGVRFAAYPPCHHLNVALNFMLSNPTDNELAIEEVCYAIIKARGYYYEHIANTLVMYGFGRFVTEDMVRE